MTTIQLLIVCLTTLVTISTIAAAAVFTTTRRGRQSPAQPGLAPTRIGHRVTVHTKQPDDQTIFGVVTGDYLDRLVLEDAELVTAGGAHPLPGRQDIATRNISWIDTHALVAPAEQTTAPSPVRASPIRAD